MRNNQPVSGHEYEFPSSHMLVSATDLTGRIQYCNPAFIAVSGFTRDELIGQPHNLIRHPDMPREAFADMWATIRDGRPWTALVKNRRKNGDHYWVHANVTPVVEKGAVVGYLSVRVKPVRAAVRATEALYARMRRGESRGVQLRRGVMVRTGVLGRLEALMRLPVATRAAIGYAITPLALLLTGLAAWQGAPPAPFWIGFGVATSLSIASWRMLTRQLAAPINDMSGFATRLAAGDLTADLQVARHDDLGDVLQALNQLKANLAAIVYDVRAQITGILDNAREISSGNVDLARRTELQAASLEETAATMEELTTTVQANADATVRALDLAREAQAAAAAGGKIAGQVEQTMAGITAASRA
ncbi:PAS domain S-box-containing protein [Paraburkholderia sp. BL25I1N1]|nr:PAS domain S-box-containing protein [Paraburkholderia sp. BL25I1N1]